MVFSFNFQGLLPQSKYLFALIPFQQHLVAILRVFFFQFEDFSYHIRINVNSENFLFIEKIIEGPVFIGIIKNGPKIAGVMKYAEFYQTYYLLLSILLIIYYYLLLKQLSEKEIRSTRRNK